MMLVSVCGRVGVVSLLTMAGALLIKIQVHTQLVQQCSENYV